MLLQVHSEYAHYRSIGDKIHRLMFISWELDRAACG
uniref:Uncharacterized protein n=1 Tax=Siphoviridae sp. ctLeh52 TaxID=2827849 RepID=A0A8S5RXH4_9CAUD|nr:MAG TPA: hypothetical protein [Siphoviridae sp. ctLeh52]